MYWFLYDREPRHERVQLIFLSSHFFPMLLFDSPKKRQKNAVTDGDKREKNWVVFEHLILVLSNKQGRKFNEAAASMR